jgi:signal transduction histidine kinase
MPFKRFPRHSLKTRVTLITLLVFLVSLGSLAYYLSRVMRDDLQQLLGEQQKTAVAFIADEIEQELGIRMRALQRVANAIPPSAIGKPESMQEFMSEHHILLSLFNGGILAHQHDSIPVVESPQTTGSIGADYMDIETLSSVLKDGVARIGHPVMHRGRQSVAIGMTAPIRNADGRIIGALSGITLLSQPNFLSQITQARHGKTGGYLLISPKHRLIVGATDASRVFESLPAPGNNPLIDRLLDGHEETVILRDTNGREMMMSDHPVQATGWILSAALPTDEAFEPIRALLLRMLYSGLPLALLAGLLIWLTLGHQLTPLLDCVRELTAMSASKAFPHALPVRRQDEIGELVASFNRLLTALANRESALHTLTSGLETTVVERTRQLRTLSAQLERAEENERRQLAQELHDNLGQMLAVIRIRLATRARQGQDAALVDLLGLLVDAEQSVRAITQQLSPPVLQSGKLDAILNWLADEMQRLFGLTIHVDVEDEPDGLGQETLTIVYRSVRELLVNAAKHARADEANILVRRIGDQLAVTVRDEGRGFSFDPFAPHLPAKPGFGLRSIRERIVDLGGHLEVDSRPGEGSTITLMMPCPQLTRG